MKALMFVCAMALAAPLAAEAQMPAQTAAAPVVPTMPASIPVGSRVGEFLAGYEDGGRRDPFGSLVALRRSATPAAIDGARSRTGLSGLVLADVTVRGILRSGSTSLAILEGPNKLSFVTRVKDRLLDATVVSVDADGVVFSEQVEGSRATTQVRKSLRPAGEGIR